MSAISGSSGNTYANSVSGLQDANLRMRAVANNVANANTDNFNPDRVDSRAEKSGGVRGIVVEANSAIVQNKPDKKEPSQTDYATEAISLTLARRAFSANLAAIQAQRAADQATLDTVG